VVRQGAIWIGSSIACAIVDAAAVAVAAADVLYLAKIDGARSSP